MHGSRFFFHSHTARMLGWSQTHHANPQGLPRLRMLCVSCGRVFFTSISIATAPAIGWVCSCPIWQVVHAPERCPAGAAPSTVHCHGYLVLQLEAGRCMFHTPSSICTHFVGFPVAATRVPRVVSAQAMVLYTYELQRRLRETGEDDAVKVFAVNPGGVMTDIW